MIAPPPPQRGEQVLPWCRRIYDLLQANSLRQGPGISLQQTNSGIVIGAHHMGADNSRISWLFTRKSDTQMEVGDGTVWMNGYELQWTAANMTCDADGTWYIYVRVETSATDTDPRLVPLTCAVYATPTTPPDWTGTVTPYRLRGATLGTVTVSSGAITDYDQWETGPIHIAVDVPDSDLDTSGDNVYSKTIQWGAVGYDWQFALELYGAHTYQYGQKPLCYLDRSGVGNLPPDPATLTWMVLDSDAVDGGKKAVQILAGTPEMLTLQDFQAPAAAAIAVNTSDYLLTANVSGAGDLKYVLISDLVASVLTNLDDHSINLNDESQVQIKGWKGATSTENEIGAASLLPFKRHDGAVMQEDLEYATIAQFNGLLSHHDLAGLNDGDDKDDHSWAWYQLGDSTRNFCIDAWIPQIIAPGEGDGILVADFNNTLGAAFYNAAPYLGPAKVLDCGANTLYGGTLYGVPIWTATGLICDGEFTHQGTAGATFEGTGDISFENTGELQISGTGNVEVLSTRVGNVDINNTGDLYLRPTGNIDLGGAAYDAIRVYDLDLADYRSGATVAGFCYRGIVHNADSYAPMAIQVPDGEGGVKDIVVLAKAA